MHKDNNLKIQTHKNNKTILKLRWKWEVKRIWIFVSVFASWPFRLKILRWGIWIALKNSIQEVEKSKEKQTETTRAALANEFDRENGNNRMDVSFHNPKKKWQIDMAMDRQKARNLIVWFAHSYMNIYPLHFRSGRLFCQSVFCFANSWNIFFLFILSPLILSASPEKFAKFSREIDIMVVCWKFIECTQWHI